MNVRELRIRFEQLQGQREHIENSIGVCEEVIRETRRGITRHEVALALFKEVAQTTQVQMQTHLSGLVSLAMTAVFDDPYELVVEFVQRRAKTECDLSFRRGDMLVDPLAAAGYGAVDVASFALRVASWFIGGKRQRNLLILDEPFKHLKGIEENRRAFQMLRQISKLLGIQMLIVSDERVPREDIIEGADRVFEVRQEDGRSRVEVI